MKPIRCALPCLVACALVHTALAGAPSFDALVDLVNAGKVDDFRSTLKANPEAVHLRNQYNLPLIHRAAMTDKPDAVAVLLDAGAKLDARDNLKRTPLHVAAGWSTVEMVELLWQRGADPNATTERGDTPLDFAMSNFYQDKKVEREKIVSFLKGRGSKMSEGEKKRQAIIREVEADLASRPDKGPEPEQSDWDSSVPVVKDFVKTKTQDPSPKFHEWSKVSPLGDKWVVRAKFEYKNALGVKRQDNRWFYIRNGKVIGSKPAQ